MRPPDLEQAMRRVKDRGLLFERSLARALAAEVERLESLLARAERNASNLFDEAKRAQRSEQDALNRAATKERAYQFVSDSQHQETLEHARDKQRAEAAEALAERLKGHLLAHDAERTLYLRRLLWLHDCSAGTTDADGYEWGIYRVKWVNGQVAECWQTNSDFSDLDAAMERDGYKLPASAKALEARVKELKLKLMRQDEVAREAYEAAVWKYGQERMELRAQNARLRGTLMRVTGSLGLVLKGAGIAAPAHKENYDAAKKLIEETFSGDREEAST